ncbi:MAG: hypothetical protein JWQ34_3650 [Mucilaginibacter sp.]|uniref:hypothetical protein n=1 Tax=Mucilaginibacter sp. TaxID=1882438 RepID=UPI0026167E93|nr:hypothetical protein [Mucilaginibacter sp.]MDB5005425.1 hypothetical protein [Mucilaginibacter sp.]
MRADNPAALRFILQDDIYLLQGDKAFASQTVTQPIAETQPEPVVEIANTTPITEPVAETPAIVFNYLGKNKKQFLIITHYPQHEFIADEHLTALQNILKRKEYDIDDVAILNLAKATVTALDELVTHFNPQKLLILGKDAQPANMGVIALNQTKQLPDLTALYSFSFDEMMSSVDNKKAFWEQMKNL